MALVLDDLGRHVLRRSHERVGLLAAQQLFGETKVHLRRQATRQIQTVTNRKLACFLEKTKKTNPHQFDVAPHVQHQVLGLQVPVHDVLLVEVVVGLHHAGRAEDGDVLVETAPEKIKSATYKKKKLFSSTYLYYIMFI